MRCPFSTVEMVSRSASTWSASSLDSNLELGGPRRGRRHQHRVDMIADDRSSGNKPRPGAASSAGRRARSCRWTPRGSAGSRPALPGSRAAPSARSRASLAGRARARFLRRGLGEVAQTARARCAARSTWRVSVTDWRNRREASSVPPVSSRASTACVWARPGPDHQLRRREDFRDRCRIVGLLQKQVDIRAKHIGEARRQVACVWLRMDDRRGTSPRQSRTGRCGRDSRQAAPSRSEGC